MASKLNSKQHRKADNISSLPDSVLCHIMSFLPTRTSVATMSLVSRRWLNLWKHLQAFEFRCEFDVDWKEFKRFSLFVNTVLALRRSRDIQKFRLALSCQSHDNFEADCVEMWIRAAAGPHLETLDLVMNNSGENVKLPPSFLMNCTNLVSLRISGEFDMNVQHSSSFHFPSLKYLYLDTDVVDSQLAFFFGCPKLETLDIPLYFKNTSLTKISVPPSSIIKRLKSTDDSFTWTYFKCSIVGNKDIELGVVGNFHSMVEAFLDTFSSCECEFADPILKLIQDYKNDDDFDDYFHLLMRHSTSKWPLQAPLLNYPKLCNLIHLKFILPCFNSNLVVDVLEKCHMLEVLIVKCSKEESSLLRTWEPQSTTVPKCLVSHLTHIHIEGYQGFEDELAFAEYILQNGLVLETMLIFVDASVEITNKYRSFKRLTDIPKGSLKCRLKFDVSASS